MINFIFAQIFGIVAIILIAFGYFQKVKTSFLLLQTIANLFYGLAFIFLGSLVGGIITLISMIRCIVFYFCQKHNFNKSYIFLILFVGTYIATDIIFWKSWFDIIPLITSIIFTFAFYLKNMLTTRYVMIPPNILLIGYNISCRTYTSAILDFIEVLIAIIAIIKVKKQKVYVDKK